MSNVLFNRDQGWLDVSLKSKCHTRDFGLYVKYPLWGVFLRDPNPNGKLQTARATVAIEN